MDSKSLAANSDSRGDRRGLSGTSIKYIAAVLMVFDHLHQFFIVQGAPTWFNMLGRPVLPIFLFMVVEGFCHTGNRRRYILRLLVCFFVMQILNYSFSMGLPITNLPPEQTPVLMNNVFSTMFMTAFYLFAVSDIQDGLREKSRWRIARGILLLMLPIAVTVVVFLIPGPLALFVPNLLIVEGGFVMVLMGILFYLLRPRRWAQMLVLVLVSALSMASSWGSGYNIQWMMVFAIIPLWLYNGERGRGGKFSKYFFYVFYPAHIYLLYFIAWFLQL